MKFSIMRETLLTPLSQVIGVVEKRQTLPILSNVLLRIGQGQLELTGTDLEVQLVARSAVDSTEEGAITVPGRKLLDILRLLPDQSSVNFDFKEDRLAIRCGSSRFHLTTLPVENYPAFDSGATELETTVPGEVLKAALDKTTFAMAQLDVRYYLNGLLLDLEGSTLRTVASDGHRLAVFQEVMPDAFPANRQIIIPRKGVLELARLLGDAAEQVAIKISPNSVSVDLGSVIFSAKLIEGRFPDYQRVMPRDLTIRYAADKDVLKGALNRVAVLSSEKQKSISLVVENEEVMVLKGQNSEQEEAEERLPIDAEGGNVSVGFNATYLQDAVGHTDSARVNLSFTAAANSCLIEDTEDQRFRYVVMPMRL